MYFYDSNKTFIFLFIQNAKKFSILFLRSHSPMIHSSTIINCDWITSWRCWKSHEPSSTCFRFENIDCHWWTYVSKEITVFNVMSLLVFCNLLCNNNIITQDSINWINFFSFSFFLTFVQQFLKSQKTSIHLDSTQDAKVYTISINIPTCLLKLTKDFENPLLNIEYLLLKHHFLAWVFFLSVPRNHPKLCLVSVGEQKKNGE